MALRGAWGRCLRGGLLLAALALGWNCNVLQKARSQTGLPLEFQVLSML